MELELFGNTYSIGKIDAMKQFHVARRVAPIVAALGLSVSQLASAGGSLKADVDLLSVAGPIADVVSHMADEEVEYVIRTCLVAVRRRVDGTGGNVAWQPVQTGTQMQFADISMQLMIRLVIEVLKENLGGFFAQPTADMSSTPSS